MNRIHLARWMMAAAVAVVLGSAAEGRAQFQLQIGVGGPRGGSIRFGTPGMIGPGPVVMPGSVRYEHYYHRDWDRDRGRDWDRHRDRWGRPNWVPPVYPGPYQNPYSVPYANRLRPGYFNVLVGPTQYYAYPTLPFGAQSVVVNGAPYYLFDGVYYQPYIYQGQTVYLVVTPPVP